MTPEKEKYTYNYFFFLGLGPSLVVARGGQLVHRSIPKSSFVLSLNLQNFCSEFPLFCFRRPFYPRFSIPHCNHKVLKDHVVTSQAMIHLTAQVKIQLQVHDRFSTKVIYGLRHIILFAVVPINSLPIIHSLFL